VAKKNEAEAEEKSSGVNALNFFEETKEELNKVVWPSRQQLISESAAVILMVSLSATIIYLVEELFKWMAGKVFI
jgi:preprotein translocase subunit SecE